jgi:transcriptional regulator with XRE-family HTH domain
MNWKNIIQDLINSGMTQGQIAKLCGGWQGQISGLLNGKRQEVHYALGKSLVELHAARCESRQTVAA